MEKEENKKKKEKQGEKKDELIKVPKKK